MRRNLTPYIIAGALLACAASTVEAQFVGFKLGVSSSNLELDHDAVTRNPITGFTGGGYLRIGLGDRFGLQAEVLSVTKGSDLRTESGTGNADIRIDYVEVPLLLQATLFAGETFAPYVQAGPTFSFEARCRYTDADGLTEDCASTGFDTTSPDFGLAAGIGFAFLAGPGVILLEGRHTWGLTRVGTDIDGVPGNIRNRSASLTAGFVVPLGRRD